MPYVNLFADVDNNPVSNRPPRRLPKRAKKQSRRQPWEDADNPAFYQSGLFGEFQAIKVDLTKYDSLSVNDKIEFDAKVRAKKVEVMEQRHLNRLPLTHPDDHTRPVDYFDSLFSLSEELRRQILATKSLLRFASGVFPKDPRNPNGGYRVQVWDNVNNKKRHVAYAACRADAELILREYWKEKGIDINVEHLMPKYFMDLLIEAKDQRKYAANSYAESQHRQDVRLKEQELEDFLDDEVDPVD